MWMLEKMSKVEVNREPEDLDAPPPSLWDSLRDIFSLAIPFTLSFAAYFSLNVLGQLFAGTFSVEQLAGFGLTTMVTNSLGFAVITGLFGGLDTMLSQAYGANPRHPMLAVYSQRALVLFSLLTIVPVGLMFYFAKQWMTAVDAADPDVVSAASELLQLLVVVIPLWILSELAMTILGCINATVETFLACLAAAITNPILLYLFVSRDWIGYQGLAIAQMSNILVMFAVQLLAASYTGSMYGFYKGKWNASQIFSGWKTMLRLSLPSMVLMLCEWSAYEVNVLLSARFLTKHHFAAVAICQQLDNSLLAAPIAVATSVSIKVGNYVGSGDKVRAQRCAAAGALLMLGLGLGGGALLASLRGTVPQLFTSDETVRSVIEDTLPFVGIFFVFDCCLSLWTGILRGLGESHKAAFGAVFAWWCVGIPLGALLFHIYPSLGAKAFYIGPALGVFVGNAVCVVFVLRATWEPYDDTDAEVLDEVQRTNSSLLASP